MAVLQSLRRTLTLLTYVSQNSIRAVIQASAATVEISAVDRHAALQPHSDMWGSLHGSVTHSGKWVFTPSTQMKRKREADQEHNGISNQNITTDRLLDGTQLDNTAFDQQLLRRSNEQTLDVAVIQQDSSSEKTSGTGTLQLADWTKHLDPSIKRLFPELHGRLFMRLQSRLQRQNSDVDAQSTSDSQSLSERSKLFGCSWWPMVDKPQSIFEVKAVEDLGLPRSKVNNMLAAGAVKGVLSLGNFMILASKSYPESLLLYAANVAAEILDPDGDGCASSIAHCLDIKRAPEGGAFTAFAGCHGDEVDAFQEKYDGGPVADLQTWIAYEMGAFMFLPHAYATSLLHGILNEEIFHLLTEGGYARKYPDQLGMFRWNSTVAKALLEAEGCGPKKPWYSHPENDCSAVDAGANMKQCTEHRCVGQTSSIFGKKIGDWLGIHSDCSEASCDITEFYHKITYLRLNVKDCWSMNIGPSCVDYYPQMRSANITSQDSLVEALEKGVYGRQLLDIMRNPAFEQLQRPPTGVYLHRNNACPTLKANFSCLQAGEPESEEDEQEMEKWDAEEEKHSKDLLRSSSNYVVANFVSIIIGVTMA
eukprot:gnl/MRDRNA2_/MRDRNA2_61436_c0_seq1.p1 gnl/MRDRNA2_/MRDRNA2_61436_c0~~gnl/MRDRNA2_/MRDRNA2_61436_c0_seq1.p1  ORF type:complete len:592 (+),score=106.04 gnl/MRDRNA2_/MRDRNA2_61436_c0_seq1:67-1842(+)